MFARVSLFVQLIVASQTLDAVRAERSPLSWSAEGGLKQNAFELRIDSKLSEGKVIYTTNEAAPAANGTPLETPLKIGSTTIIRAQSFNGGRAVSEIETRSFIFPAAALEQTGAGFPKSWGVNDGKPVPAYYEMAKALSRTRPRGRN